jgi:branched-chain amino acid aminotransferase
MKVWLNGELVDASQAKLSVFDHGTLYGDGVFEGIRIYAGKIFQVAAHIDRLLRSADSIRLKMPYAKDELIEAMYQTLQANGRRDGYIRLVVTRGAGNLGLSPFKCLQPGVFIIADTIEMYPRQMYEEGMPVIVAKTLRTSRTMLDPAIKSLNYLNNIMAKMEAVDAGAGEAIMLNDKGYVAEATGDNVFIVRSGVLVTPPVEAGFLSGVTRGVVMRLAGELGIPVAQENFKPADLYTAQECFLTGTAAEVIAVATVDGRNIGQGKVGPLTRKLMTAFRQFTQSPEAEGR